MKRGQTPLGLRERFTSRFKIDRYLYQMISVAGLYKRGSVPRIVPIKSHIQHQ